MAETMAHLLRTSLILGLILCSFQASADITVDKYREFSSDPESGVYRLLENYVDGLGTGAYWSNLKFIEIYGVPLFCPRTDVAITVENYMTVLEDAVDKYGQARHERIGKLLIIGLMEAYPCN